MKVPRFYMTIKMKMMTSRRTLSDISVLLMIIQIHQGWLIISIDQPWLVVYSLMIRSLTTLSKTSRHKQRWCKRTLSLAHIKLLAQLTRINCMVSSSMAARRARTTLKMTTRTGIWPRSERQLVHLKKLTRILRCHSSMPGFQAVAIKLNVLKWSWWRMKVETQNRTMKVNRDQISQIASSPNLKITYVHRGVLKILTIIGIEKFKPRFLVKTSARNR